MSNILEREGKVVVSGAAQGLQRAAQETWSNVQTGADEFRRHPLTATSSYIGNHWQDFAVGAAITAIAPGRTASGLLMAWSLKSPALATLDAAARASLPDADTDALKNIYAERIGHEGAALVSSLPMTLAGGAFGRAGTNALLGEGRALSSVASGEIGLPDIRRNYNNLMESALPTKTKVLLTDLDDTAFPLKDYLVPSLQKNTTMIAQRMNISEDTVIDALGPHRIHPWILEESDLAKMWKGTPQEFTDQIVKPFWRNDAEAMRNLKPFDGVVQTWEEAHRQGIKVVALTNAPRPWAINRLRAAGLDGYVDHLYAMDTPEPKVGSLLSPSFIEHGRELMRTAETTPNGIGEIHTLPQGYQKPDMHGVQSVLADLGVKPRQTLAIGDNWASDGAAPEYFGVPFIWAKYGRDIVNPEQRDFLKRFKPRADDTVPVEPARVTVIPPKTIAEAESYTDLLRFLNRAPNLSDAWRRVRYGA